MDQVILYSSNGDCLTLNAGDLITPIIYPEPNSASMSGNYPLEIHIHNGLIPSLMEMCIRDSLCCFRSSAGFCLRCL